MDTQTVRALANEVLAVILPDPAEASAPRAATVLLRGPDGHLEVRTVTTREVLADRRLARGCVRRGTPIWDPTTRALLGYELEGLPAPR